MKKIDYFYLILIIIFSLIPFYNLLSVQFPDSHDTLIHLNRIYALNSFVEKGIVLPRWIPNANYGFGSPIFTFIYAFPYYFAVILLKLGINLSVTYRLLIIIPSVLSGVGMYLWLKNKYSKLSAVGASILYIWTPYHFLDAFIRGSIGELWFFAFTPYIFTILENPSKDLHYFIGPLIVASQLYSHHGLFMLSLPVYLLYLLFIVKNKQIAIKGLIVLMLGLLLTTFFWLPALYYSTTLKISVQTIGSLEFLPFLSLIRSRWEGGIVDGKNLIMSFQLGYANIIIIILSLTILGKSIFRKIHVKVLVFWLTIIFISIFLTQPISLMFWKHLPFLINIQFPFRLLYFVMLSSSVLFAYLVNFIKDKGLLITAFLVILLAIYGNRNHLRTTNKNVSLTYLQNYNENYDSSGEILPYYVSLSEIKGLSKDFTLSEIFSLPKDNGYITSQSTTPYYSQAETLLDVPGEIFIKKIYFPGWRVFLNSKNTNNFMKVNGIRINTPKGQSSINISYHDPLLIIIANMISVFTLILITLLLLNKINREFMKGFLSNLKNY